MYESSAILAPRLYTLVHKNYFHESTLFPLVSLHFQLSFSTMNLESSTLNHTKELNERSGNHTASAAKEDSFDSPADASKVEIIDEMYKKIFNRTCKETFDEAYNEGFEDETALSSPPPPGDYSSLAVLEEQPFDDKVGQKCELQAYDIPLNIRGERIALQSGTWDSIDAEYGPSDEVALILFRNYDPSKKVESTSLNIHSPCMKSALRKVIHSYADINFDSNGPVVLHNEPRCLFHYRKELQTYMETNKEERAKKHVEFLLQYMSKTLQREIQVYAHMMENTDIAPRFEFPNLWMAFKPGDLMYVIDEGVEHIYRLTSMRREKKTSWSGY